MTSIIKVDTIQTSAGGTPTASSLGIGGVGKIGQVVTANYTTTGATTNSSTFTQIGPSLSITPTSTSSKIMLFLNGGSVYIVTDRTAEITIYRDSTNLGQANGIQRLHANSSYLQAPTSVSYLDSPASTSAITYAMYVKTTTTASNVSVQDTTTQISLTAMEVLA